MEQQVNMQDGVASIIALVAGVVASLLEFIRVETIVDALTVTIITLLVSFYGNRLLRWIHGDKRDKKRNSK